MLSADATESRGTIGTLEFIEETWRSLHGGSEDAKLQERSEKHKSNIKHIGLGLDFKYHNLWDIISNRHL